MDGTLADRFQRAGLGARTLTALIGIPLIFLTLWAGGWWWAGLAAIVAGLGWMELDRLNRPTPLQPLDAMRRLLMPMGAAVMFVFTVGLVDFFVRIMLAGWFLFVGISLPIQYFWSNFPRANRRPGYWSALALNSGPLYLGIPLGLLARWRFEYPARSILAFLLVIWANDTAAYFVGLAAGRHKLAPRISPGKSWEGALAGVAAGGLVGLVASSLLGMRPALGIVFGVLTTIASQIGDLLESAMKRKAGVKDSGAILPGHGGILDRFDGILVAAPIAYVLVRLWATPP